MPSYLGIIWFMKEIVLLGSTGSIGTQTLDVALAHNIKVKALSANRNVKLLEEQARRFSPEKVCVTDESCYNDLKTRLSDTSINVSAGEEAICSVAATKCDTVVNAVVGMAGLAPTIAAIRAGNSLALANKETLVAGGELVTGLAKQMNVSIYPIDSEHSAIFQCLMGNECNSVSKIILTASGGPFFGYSIEQLRTVTKAQALKHPNWEMGAKITIDSATLMNKGLELIEAVRLFNVAPEQIEIVVHRQSILHSAVEFEDGSVVGQMGVPDMRIPIQLALTYPKRLPSPAKRLSITDIGALTFEKPDYDVFICLNLAKKAIKKGGNMPCILNCANEAAVKLFLNDKIRFYQIGELVEQAMEKVGFIENPDMKTLFETKKATEEFVDTRC